LTIAPDQVKVGPMPAAVAAAAADGATSVEQPLRPDLFVSYSRVDEAFVRRLAAELESRGKDVWVDRDDIRKGADWHATMLAGIEAAKVVVPVLSPDFAASEVCAEEVAYAVDHNKRLVPILLRSVERGSLRPELTTPNWILFGDDTRFDEAAGELVDAVEADLDWLDQSARLLVRALEWNRADAKAKRSLLLRGSELRAGEDWLAAQSGHREQATPEHVDFIVASRREANRRQRITVAAVLVALAVSIGLAIFALISRSDAIAQSKISRSRELAASAVSQLETDPELAIALAAAGANGQRTPQAEDALRRALRVSHARVVLRGHAGPVRSAAFDPNGRRVVTAGQDGTARVWDAATGRQVLVLRHRGPVLQASFSPDGRLILTASADGTARLWDAADGTQRAVLEHDGPVRKASFSHDGTLVVTASDDGTARVWRTENGASVVVERMRGRVVDAAISPDNRFLAAAGGGSQARIWSLPAGKLLHVLRHISPSQVYSVTFSPSGKLLATAADDERAIVWNVATGKDISFQSGADNGAVYTAAFSPDGKLVATGNDGAPEVWSTATGFNESGGSGMVLDGASAAKSIAFSPDGKLVAAAGVEGVARLWQAASGKPVAVLRQAGSVNTVAFSRDGTRVVTASDDGKAVVWATVSGEPLTPVKLPQPAQPPAVPAKARDPYGTSQSVAVSPDGTVMAVFVSYGNGTQYGRLARLPGGELIFSKVPDWVSPAFNPDSKFLVSGSLRPNNVTVREAPSWHAVRMLDQGRPLQGELFLRDGRLVTTSPDGTMSFWNVATGEKLFVIHTHGGLGGGDFSPNQEVIFSRDAKGTDDPASGNGTARLWDATAGRQLAVLHHSAAITGFQFSADSRLLITVSTDHTARVWSLPKGGLVAVLAHDGAVDGGSFSPDDKIAVTTSFEDKTVRLWRIPDGTQLDVLHVSPGSYHPGKLEPGGRVVVTGSERFTCEVCGSLDDLLRLAAMRTTRALTPVERARYGLG
jgi:WD40 repeat protein